jgi:hypothetical protein
MRSRRVGCIAALFIVSAGSAAWSQNPRTLPAFRSDQEVASYLRRLVYQREQRRWAASNCKNGVTLSRAKGGATVIRGRITDQSGKPIAAASVTLEGLDAGATSSLDGAYRLALAPEQWKAADTLILAVRFIGYQPERRVLKLAPGDSLEVNVGLCSSQTMLQEVAVTGVAAMQAERASITNTQHAGVDEGDIVKLQGNYLIVLRRGRLFTIGIGDGSLAAADGIDAFGPGIDPDDTWYDELIVWHDKVVVIGYSYERGGTELGVFRLGPTGRLRHVDTYHLRSNDYYSSRNYASRLVEGKLVFYTPLYLPWDSDDPLAGLPAMRRWDRRAKDGGRFERIATARRIYRPAGELSTDDVTLHTVTSCDLSHEPLTCEATVMIGPPGRVFYVSPQAVYVWLSEWGQQNTWPGGAAAALLCRMPLDGSGPTALGVAGSPVDQFSFLESVDGYINVLVRSEAFGDAMWAPEWADGATALLRVPLTSFGDGTRRAEGTQYRPLPAPTGEGETFQNRFVGDYLLYGTGSGWVDAKHFSATLFVVPWRGGPLTRLALPHGVDRIEVLGADAVVVGADEKDLHFTGIQLPGGRGDPPALRQAYTLANASQGELRSHGFFYRADGADSGVLGLPVRGAGRRGYEHLFDGSAFVVFIANRGGAFQPLGKLDAMEVTSQRDWCKASCVDWYGNARPIFIGDRVFALLGYELVEGRIRSGRMRQVGRISYAPRPASAMSP